MHACVFVHFRVFIAHLLRGGETVAQPIQAVQIYYEHPFGAEREVLREFFSFVGCLVKTTMMPVETMLEKHKSLVNPESERITHLFLISFQKLLYEKTYSIFRKENHIA